MTQLQRVERVMRDGGYRSLTEIATRTGDSPQSISARLRDLRKPQYGGFSVNRVPHRDGHYLYRVLA